ncbi:MAG: helical backbone metal receptor [Thermoplasmata archaeon]
MNESKVSMKQILLVVLIAAVAVAGGFSAGYVIGQASSGIAGGGLTVVDDYDRIVVLKNGFATRVISIAPTPTEILFAIGAGNLVIAVDRYSDYPSEATALPKVGDAFSLDTELIVSMKPDLVICGDLVPSGIDALESNGIPYMIVAARTVEDALDSIKLVGYVTNHTAQAEALVASLEARMHAVTNLTLAPSVDHPKVYLEYDCYESDYYTFGPGSFGNDLIRLAGGTNIGEGLLSEYPAVDDEFVIGANPEIIVYCTNPWTTVTKETFGNRSGWDQIDAVVSDSIFSIDVNLIARYGPRLIDGLEQLAQVIHPELFP